MTDRKTWKTGLSFGALSEEKLHKAAAAGLDLVEINGIDDPAHWKDVPKWEKDCGVKAWSFHLPTYNIPILSSEEWKGILEKYAALFACAGEAGVKYMVSHTGYEPYFSSEREARMQASIEHMGQMSDICKKYGLVLCVENLPRLCLGNCGDDMLRYMESNSDLRIVFDTNHLLKEHYTEFIKNVGRYIVTTHISDYDFVDEKHAFPLRGLVDWKELQGCLEEADYTGPFLYECSPPGGDWSLVKQNHETLKNL